MGFIDSKVHRSGKFAIFIAPVASDHSQRPQSCGGEQDCPSGHTMAGNVLIVSSFFFLKKNLMLFADILKSKSKS